MDSYFFKASISLIILYALYWVMLRYEFNHRLNRVIGLMCVIFSVSFPFIQFKELPKTSQLTATVYAVEKTTIDFQHTVSSAISTDAIDIFLILYGIGASVFLLRCLIGMATLLKLYIRSSRFSRWGFKVVVLPRSVSPFTFFNILFIGHDHVDGSEMDVMLQHEQVHRDHYHSIDAMLLEILTIIFWFNPVIWLFRRDIKAEHEYLADEEVLKKGMNLFDYQLLLFRARTGISIGIGNYLSNNISLIKRLKMMTQPKSNSRGSYLRVSLFLALMSAILFLSAFTGRYEGSPVDKIATYEQGEEAMFKIIRRTLKYPSGAMNENRSGLVKISFTVNSKGDVENPVVETGAGGYLLKEVVVVGYLKSPASGQAKEVNDALKEEVVHAVKALGKFIPAEKDGKPVSSVLTLPVKFKLQ